MKHDLAPIRPAMTALAAVIALSSTPLLAQAADPAAAQPAPVMAPPPAPAPAVAEPTVVQAAAPDASPAMPAPAPVEAAPAQPAMKTVGTPVEHVADAPSDSQPAAHSATVRHAAMATPTPKAAPRAVKSVTPVLPAASPAPPTHVAKVPPAAEKMVATSAPATPVSTVQTVRTASTSHDETLPIAGAIGLGVLAIGAFALARRKRHEEDDELVLGTPVDTVAMAAPEPVVAAPIMAGPVAAPVVARTAGPDRLSNGFDLSRFGPHTRAAYLGPTPDNPSHSLKRRLKRASFFDQREREAAVAGATLQEPVMAKAPQAEADAGQITVRMAPQRQSTRFGYVLQR